MARTAKTLAIGSVQSTDLQQLYLVPSGFNMTAAVMSFTNTTDTSIVIDIYHNDGSTDFLIKSLTLPAGSGRERIYYGFQRRTLNAGHSVKVQANNTSKFNYSVHGSENEL